MKRLVLLIATLAALALSANASARDVDNDFPLTVVSQTSSTITFSYPKQPGYGYLYSTNGTVVSRSNNPDQTTVKFGKVTSGVYDVDAIAKGTNGHHPPALPPPSNFQASGITQAAVTLTWSPVASATNYRIYRDGALIGQGPGSNGGYADSWGDIGLTCATAYQYGLEYQTSTGATSPRATLTATTAACSDSGGGGGGTGNVIEVAGSITNAALRSAIAAAPAGAVTVRPAAGYSTFTVTGDMAKLGGDPSDPDYSLARPDVTIQHAVIGDLQVGSAGSGFVIEDSSVHSFLIDHAANWTIRRVASDFAGVTHGAHYPFDVNGGSIVFHSTNGQIVDSTFTRAYVAADPEQHTEAWFIGCGNSGLVFQGNRFDDNGSTAHLFFTWFAYDCGSASSSNYPRGVCVRGNTFTRSRNPYHHIDMRAEIPSNLSSIDPGNVWDNSAAALSADSSWVRAC